MVLSHLLVEKIKIYNFQFKSSDLINIFENEVMILKARQSEDFLKYLHKTCPGIQRFLDVWRKNKEYYHGNSLKYIDFNMFWEYKFDIFFNILKKFISHKYNKFIYQIIECEFENCGFRIYQEMLIISQEAFNQFIEQLSIDLAYIFKIDQSRIKMTTNVRIAGLFGNLYRYEWIYVELLDKM